MDVVGEGLVMGVRRVAPVRPGHTPRLASLARAPFAGSERGRTWSHAKGAGVSLWPLAARAYPACLLRSYAPLSERRGQGGVRPFRVDERGANGVSGVCAGMGGVRRGRTVWVGATRAPRLRPGHTPRACCARTRPFRWERKGQGGFPPARE